MHCKTAAKLSGDLTNTKGAQSYQLGDINTRQVSWYVTTFYVFDRLYFLVLHSHAVSHYPCICGQFICLCELRLMIKLLAQFRATCARTGAVSTKPEQ